MYRWRPLQHASCALSLRFIFPVWKWDATKNTAYLFVNNLQKFRKFTVSSISRFGDIKEVWYKAGKMSLYKPGQVKVCFSWITEKSQITELKITFHDDNFRVDFFQRHKFVIFSVDFFSVKCEHISWNYSN